MPFDDRDFPNLPKGERAISPHSRRLVAMWLYIIAFMILVLAALGGATRLTGSGLSIMEWAPVTGTFPPLTEAEWRRLYGLYQGIAQYSVLHEGFGLEGFKRIFWLEWVHRLWGRLTGAAFLIPLLWFGLTGRLEFRLALRLAGLLVLGLLQGVVGWLMVASGFFPDATAVAPPRLVAHLVLALLLYGGVLWTAFGLWPPGPRLATAGSALKTFAWITLGLLGLTIAAGGLISGLHAGLTYNTFPLMDGSLVPEGYAELRPFARNLIENIAAVQFDHRVLASLSLLSALGLTVAALPYRDVLGWRAACVPVAAATQYALGVATLLLVVPVDLAVAHQVCAVLLLTSVLLVVHAVRGEPGNAPEKLARGGSVAMRRRTRRIWPGRGHGQTGQASPFHGSVTPSDTRQSAAEDPKP